MKYFILTVFMFFLGCISVKNNIIEKKTIRNYSAVSSKDTNIKSYSIISYFIPDTMIIGRLYDIKIKIKANKEFTPLPSLDLLKLKNVNVISAICVSIEDPMPKNVNSFKIETLNRHSLIDTNFSEWDYELYPERDGFYMINVIVSTIHNNIKTDDIYKNYVLVETTEPVKNKNGWSKHWPWLMASIIIPLSTLLWKTRFKKKQE